MSKVVGGYGNNAFDSFLKSQISRVLVCVFQKVTRSILGSVSYLVAGSI